MMHAALTVLLLLQAVTLLFATSDTKYEINPEDRFQPILENKRSLPSKDLQSRSCSVQQIKGVPHFDAKKFSGDWYEMAKTTTSVPFFKSSVWRFQPMENSANLAFFFSARVESGHCLNPIAGEAIVSTTNPDALVLSYDGLKGRVEEEMKLIYTDYDNIAVFYACRHVVLDTGSCHPDGVFVSVLSRHHTITQPNIVRNISDTISSVCVDKNRIIPQDSTKSCNLDELDVRDYKDSTSGDAWPVCKHSAVCTVACPPCCHENEQGCIICECPVIPKACDNDVSICPNDCHVVERMPGCKECICAGIGHAAPFAAMPTEDTKDFYKIKNIHECPTTCRTVKSQNQMYCNCTNQLICKQPMAQGSCKMYEDRYYFDYKDETCHAFNYGGCYGNYNNFPSLMKCYAMCKDVCDLPVDPGTDGEAHLERYYFNRVTESCDIFTYRGLGGNENNFLNISECRMRCPERSFQKNKEIFAAPPSPKECNVKCSPPCVSFTNCDCFCDDNASGHISKSWACLFLTGILLLFRK